jgi:hypothetical protein
MDLHLLRFDFLGLQILVHLHICVDYSNKYELMVLRKKRFLSHVKRSIKVSIKLWITSY